MNSRPIIHCEAPINIRSVDDNDVPPMGTPEFRAFVQTPEWREMRHEQALLDDEAWKETRRRQQADALVDMMMPTIVIDSGYGRTDPKLWSRDWREGFAIDHPLRMDYEESIYGKTEAELMAEDMSRLGALHEATLQLTIPA